MLVFECAVGDMEDCKSSNTSVEKQEEEAEEVLKKKISDHPLYGLLVDTHLECLKASSIVDMDQNQEMNLKLPSRNPSSSNYLCQSELDYFMEAYCSALRQLKEALEQPQQETIAFIKSMQAQLMELNITDTAESDRHEASASSSVD